MYVGIVASCQFKLYMGLFTENGDNMSEMDNFCCFYIVVVVGQHKVTSTI